MRRGQWGAVAFGGGFWAPGRGGTSLLVRRREEGCGASQLSLGAQCRIVRTPPAKPFRHSVGPPPASCQEAHLLEDKSTRGQRSPSIRVGVPGGQAGALSAVSQPPGQVARLTCPDQPGACVELRTLPQTESERGSVFISHSR